MNRRSFLQWTGIAAAAAALGLTIPGAPKEPVIPAYKPVAPCRHCGEDIITIGEWCPNCGGRVNYKMVLRTRQSGRTKIYEGHYPAIERASFGPWREQGKEAEGCVVVSRV